MNILPTLKTRRMVRWPYETLGSAYHTPKVYSPMASSRRETQFSYIMGPENERLVCSVPTDDLLPITHAETNLIEEVDDVNTDDDLNESEIEHIDFDDGDEEYEDEDEDSD
ncbi:hypothetical protein R6Q59_012741 [Mikania micrantha]